VGRLNPFIDHSSLGAVLRQTCGAVTDDEVRAVHTRSGGYAEEFLRRPGAKETISIDASACEGAFLVPAAPIVAAVVSTHQRASALRTISRPRLNR
jgi:hypothetical protein